MKEHTTRSGVNKSDVMNKNIIFTPPHALSYHDLENITKLQESSLKNISKRREKRNTKKSDDQIQKHWKNRILESTQGIKVTVYTRNGEVRGARHLLTVPGSSRWNLGAAWLSPGRGVAEAGQTSKIRRWRKARKAVIANSQLGWTEYTKPKNETGGQVPASSLETGSSWKGHGDVHTINGHEKKARTLRSQPNPSTRTTTAVEKPSTLIDRIA